MLEEIPTACDRGSKCNAQGYKVSWNGYKLHLDTACCGVPVAALLSSASMHDSRAAIPLSLMSAARVTNLYDVMDALRHKDIRTTMRYSHLDMEGKKRVLLGSKTVEFTGGKKKQKKSDRP